MMARSGHTSLIQATPRRHHENFPGIRGVDLLRLELSETVHAAL